MVALSGALMPGPLLAVTISEAGRRGAVAGPLLIAGHAVLEAVLVAAILLGCARFLEDPRVTSVIALVGGIILCWMGVGMLRSCRGASLCLDAPRGRRMHPVASGIVVSLANPYWTIWWATIGLGYLVIGLRFGLVGVAVFFAGHILADLAWYTLVSVGIASGRGILPDRVYRGMLALCGVVLIGFGAWFLWTGYAACRAVA